MAFGRTAMMTFEIRVLFILVLWAIAYGLVRVALKSGQRIRPRVLTAAVTVLVSLIGVGRLISELPKSPLILGSSVDKSNKVLARDADLRVVFTTPVMYDTLTVHTNPETEFTLKKEGYLWNLLPFGTSVTLVPKTVLPPGEKIMVYFSNIKGPFTKGFGGELPLDVAVEDPQVASVTPADNSEQVPVSQEVTVKLSAPVFDLSEWSVRSDPELPLLLQQKDTKTLRITHTEPFRQGTAYRLLLTHTPLITSRADRSTIRKLDPRVKAELDFSTVKAVFISSFTPGGSAVDPTEPFAIVFDEAIDSRTFSQYLKISPEISYTTDWDAEEKKLTIRHEELKKDTKYSITLTQGIKTKRGGTLESQAVFDVETAGALAVKETNPSDGSTNVPVETSLKITFDQKVPDTIADHISITPEVEGTWKVTDAVADFTPTDDFAYEKQYTVRVGANAPSVYGLASTSEKAISFTTQPDQVILKVPVLRQQTSFTCNFAAARMLLAYRGKSVTEQDLINKVGYQARRGSGNPHKGYVDNFGTFWEAVLKSTTAYQGAHLITSGNLTDLLKEVKKGNPVMTWGQNGWSNPYDISWTASDGTPIKAVNGMHSVVVIGYVGSVENPRQIWVNDPWRGQYAMSPDEFMRRWSYYKMAMVIE